MSRRVNLSLLLCVSVSVFSFLSLLEETKHPVSVSIYRDIVKRYCIFDTKVNLNLSIKEPPFLRVVR